MMLTGGRIRYRLQDTPIVGGVSVSETHTHVIVLVATVASIHRLVFPHPCRRTQTVRYLGFFYGIWGHTIQLKLTGGKEMTHDLTCLF